MTSQMDRRDFVKTVAVSAGTAVAQHLLSPMLSADTTPGNNGMIYRTLGRTGERVSSVGLGGWHIGPPSVPERDSLQLIRQAIDRGINFLDNCQSYNAGESESRMGKALQDGYREKVFLMTKIDGRTKQEANRQIDRCLSRLRTDRIDLLQFHEIIRLEDPDRIFAGGGAMEAMLAAQRAGKVRYMLHGPQGSVLHLRMLDVARNSNFRFDAVQMPLNVMDAHDFRSFTKQVLPAIDREGIAPLGMKAFGDHVILDSKTVTPIEALQFCFNLSIAVQITGIDSQKILDQALEAVRTFKPLTQAQVANITERTRVSAANGKYELYKTTTNFDGTQQHPEWLE